MYNINYYALYNIMCYIKYYLMYIISNIVGVYSKMTWMRTKYIAFEIEAVLYSDIIDLVVKKEKIIFSTYLQQRCAASVQGETFVID